jgi:uncharacterized protein
LSQRGSSGPVPDKPRLQKLLGMTNLVVGDEQLVAVQAPRRYTGELLRALTRMSARSFSLTVDDLEASLVLPCEAWRSLDPGFPGTTTVGPLRMITLDVVLPFDVVGFFAAISAALARHEISLYALSAFSRDHILVQAEDLPRAVAVLEALIATANE